MASALAASSSILPSNRWSQPDEAPPVRGPTYFEDGKKIAAIGGPLCKLFACQVFELDKDHLAGASAALLQSGSLVPPESAKFVLTVHYMTPRPSKQAKPHAILVHSYSDIHPDQMPGAVGKLVQELWKGDGVSAITRCKVLAALRQGPHLVRATMSWIGLDESRPMLMCRQVHASINRATLSHRSGGGTFAHVEIAFDLYASPLCNQMYKYAWPSLSSVDVSIMLLLEGRTNEHLPEHPLNAVAFTGIDPSEVLGQPPEWPSDASEIPGEMVGSYTSGRAANDVGSWQETRRILTNLKSAAKGAAAKGGWFS